MKRILAALGLTAILMPIQAAMLSCEIFIPGDGTSSVTNMRSISWEANLELNPAAQSMSTSLLQALALCRRPAILKAHGYGASVAFYILGLGKRFANLYPQHPYVQIFKKTVAMYSYNGAFRGTPIMDSICAGENNPELTETLSENCILSLTTSTIHHPSSEVNSPGVLIYLISTVSEQHYGTRSRELLDNYGLSWQEMSDGEIRNQSDGVVPLFSSSACASISVMDRPDDNCHKINSVYFQDFLRLENYPHYQIYDDPGILQRIDDEL